MSLIVASISMVYCNWNSSHTCGHTQIGLPPTVSAACPSTTGRSVTVPSYSATEYFNNLRKSFPEYQYKEATLNPTNLRDRAEGWEVDVVNHFRENADARELIGEREGVMGPMLYLARPLRISDAKCLACHSTVDAAPQTMLDQYGPANGFGWKHMEVVGAQIVSVPYTLPLKRADSALRGFLYLLTGLFVFLFITVNFLLYTLVVRPVRKLRSIADKVSLGAMDAPEFSAAGTEEMTSLGQSFNRMRRSLVEALAMLQEGG